MVVLGAVINALLAALGGCLGVFFKTLCYEGSRRLFARWSRSCVRPFGCSGHYVQ